MGLQARGADSADLPSQRRIENLGRRSLSAGLSWQPRPRETWRLSVAQVAASDDVSLKSVNTMAPSGPISYLARESWHRDVVWRLGLDWPL